MGKYPDCFPENFESEILPSGAADNNLEVYRIAKYGIINRDAFISTYEEIQRKLIPPRKKLDKNDPSTYSTSCQMELADAEYLLTIFMRHKPDAIITKGATEPSCGVSQITSERTRQNNSHVDWWIYKDASPYKYFSEVNQNE